MGFGTLFIGYFLLLNIGYYSITDIIAASVMLLGLYNLSRINKYFKASFAVSAVFALFSVAEIYFGISDMFFGASTSPTLISTFSAIRFLTVGLISVLILLGIRTVSIEVELEEMPVKCLSRAIITTAIYGFGILLETPLLHFLGAKTLAYLSVIFILLELYIIIMNLTAIYGAYMHICMPEDNIPDDGLNPKVSRFGFVNKYRERKAEKAREEAEYRLKKLEELSRKKKKGRKRK